MSLLKEKETETNHNDDCIHLRLIFNALQAYLETHCCNIVFGVHTINDPGSDDSTITSNMFACGDKFLVGAVIKDLKLQFQSGEMDHMLSGESFDKEELGL